MSIFSKVIFVGVTINMPNFGLFEEFPVCFKFFEIFRVTFARRNQNLHDLVHFLQFRDLVLFVLKFIINPSYHTFSGLIVKINVWPTFSNFLI